MDGFGYCISKHLLYAANILAECGGVEKKLKTLWFLRMNIELLDSIDLLV